MFYSNAHISEVKGRKERTFKGALRYKDPDSGKWKTKYKTFKCEKKQDAKKALNDWWAEEEHKAQRAITYTGETVRNRVLSTLSHQHLMGYISEESYPKMVRCAEVEMFPYIGDKGYYDLTSAEIQAWINHIAKIYKPSTIRHVFAQLKKPYKADLKAGKIDRNLCDAVDLPREKITEHNSLSLEAQQRLLKLTKEGRQAYFLFVRIGLFTGMRVGEISGLKWGDIDFARKIIKVDRSAKLLMEDGHNRVVYGLPKNEKKRTIPLLPQLEEVLIEEMEAKNPSQDSFIIGGNPFTRSSGFRSYCKYHDVRGICDKPITSHSLRHTFASNMIRANVDIMALSRILGHKKTSTTTDLYADLLPDSMGVAMEKFSTFLDEEFPDAL